MIHKLDNALLNEKMERFDFSNPPVDPMELATDLVETMRKYNGIGLAANQIGLPYRAVAIMADPAFVMFNPRIVDLSEKEIVLDEGCLSFPGLIVKVKRPEAIRVRYTQANGETLTEKFIGMTARVIMHEMDHIDGILYFNRASRFHRDRAMRKYERIKKRA